MEKKEVMPSSTLYVEEMMDDELESYTTATCPTPASWAAWMTWRASEVVTSEVGPFSKEPIVTTTFEALPMALAIDSASWKVDSTALSRLDSSDEIS